MRAIALSLAVMGSVLVGAQTSPLSPEQRAQFHGPYSEAVEPFRIVGNIHYVGAKNIASYLLTTPQGHIMIDTGTREMGPVIRTNVEKLGFKLKDVKILLSGHAHFDHVQGHAAMKQATGARVMAIGDDAAALASGTDRSPLNDEGWEPVKVDRVLKDGDTVTLGGTTLRASGPRAHAGLHGGTTRVGDAGKPYSVAFYACGGPNAGVRLVGNSRFHISWKRRSSFVASSSSSPISISPCTLKSLCRQGRTDQARAPASFTPGWLDEDDCGRRGVSQASKGRADNDSGVAQTDTSRGAICRAAARSR